MSDNLTYFLLHLISSWYEHKEHIIIRYRGGEVRVSIEKVAKLISETPHCTLAFLIEHGRD